MNWIKDKLKRFWRWLTGAAVVSTAVALTVANFSGEPVIIPPVVNSPTYFAELDANKNVLRVLVVTQEFINTGKLGDPTSWVQTYYDNSQRKNYAGIGYKYDSTLNAFIPPKPYDSWVLNEVTAQWKSPVAKPTIGKSYE